MRRLLFALAALALWALPAHAQGPICPTPPFGTSNNQCASTAFVTGAVASSNVTVGTTQIFSGNTGRVLYDNAGILGEYTITGTAGSAVLSLSPSITTPSIASPTFSGTVAGANTIPLTILQQSAANTMLGNWTGSAANVLANTMPSCPDSGGNHLNYVSGTGITCGTGLGNGITALTGDVTATGPGSVAATLATAQPGAHTWALGQTFSAAMTYGGVTLSNSVTGTGAMVLGTSPSISGLTVTGSFTATGLVGNASLTNPATTVNSQTCTLGSTCTVTAVASSVVVGTTTIGSGADTRILYDNAGTLGEYTITGTGTVVAMKTSPSLTTPALGVATATSVAIAGCTIGTDELCVTGQTSLGATSIAGLTVTGSFTATGLVGNASLVNPATTVNGQTCTLGSTCTVTAAATTITVGTTAVASGTTTRVLFDNAGTLGEYVISGTGNVAMTTSPAFTTPSLGAATATSINGLTITSSTGTLTVTNGKTASFSNSITFAGTDATTMTFPNATATIPRVVASGAKALATGAISSATCTSAQTDTATGTLTTDAPSVSFAADPTAVTGYVPLTSGMLTIIYYPTVDTMNFKVCNNTAGSITPGAITINWRVVR